MKIFSKFKKMSRDIKLIIITALIVSCVGVYAAGECIISATADDVTYNGSTVQAAIDELYSMAQSYCPPGYECIKNNLYNKLAKDAVLDDRASTYVTSSSGIDFSQISSDTNGKGIYEIASTKNDTYPIYYFRGAVDNNNVKFGGFCWKAIRTTDTGGVKMIYNGEPDQDGYCTNTTGESTQIGKSYFNRNSNSLADVGYMYGNTYKRSSKDSLNSSNAIYVYGNDVTYSGGTYTLTNTMTSTGIWSNDYNKFNNNHYTCFSSGNTCSSVYYIYYTSYYKSSSYSTAHYITLTNGKKVEDALDEMFSNTNNSSIKTTVDNWYNSNLLNYSSYIEDTVYCNDRSISALAGWDPNGGDTTKELYFGPRSRISTDYLPSLECSRIQDRFTVSSNKGNGSLTYPIGLITADELVYAGGKFETNNNTFYLNTDQYYWVLSPYNYTSLYGVNSYGFIMYFIKGNGRLDDSFDMDSEGVRPVISLSTNTTISSGDGTSTNPYVIETN